jgi:hypothetical protein
MAINTSKVLVGGIAAGVVMNISGFVIQGMLLGKRMEAEMLAAAPTLQGKGMSGGVIAARVITQFVVGILLVWLYAAMRPRFGPGMKTAAYAALVIWICGFLFYLDWLYVEMMTVATYAIVSVVMIVTLLLAAWVGGKLYTEEGAGAPMA